MGVEKRLTEMGLTTGQCLCGAVQVTALSLSGEMSACHCSMCTRWSGSVQMFIDAPAAGVKITGPVKTFRSTPFSERAWCDTCGTALWLRNVEGDDTGIYEFSPGLFENAGGARLTRVVYSDCGPGGLELAGDLQRVTKAEYEQENAHV